MLRFFGKNTLGRCIRQICFIGDQNAGRGERSAEAFRRGERHGDGFAGFGGHSANQEAPEVILRGSWRLHALILTNYTNS